MSHSVMIGLTPDPPELVYRQLLRFFTAEDADMVHLNSLPDGYSAPKDGLAVVVTEDVQQGNDVAHTRDLVTISVYGATHATVQKFGRNIYTVMTSGIPAVSLGISSKQSMFFGSGPSFKPTGFVSTMSLSVGIGKIFRPVG